MFETKTYGLFLEHYHHIQGSGKNVKYFEISNILEILELKHFIEYKLLDSILKEYYITLLTWIIFLQGPTNRTI